MGRVDAAGDNSTMDPSSASCRTSSTGDHWPLASNYGSRPWRGSNGPTTAADADGRCPGWPLRWSVTSSSDPWSR